MKTTAAIVLATALVVLICLAAFEAYQDRLDCGQLSGFVIDDWRGAAQYYADGNKGMVDFYLEIGYEHAVDASECWQNMDLW